MDTINGTYIYGFAWTLKTIMCYSAAHFFGIHSIAAVSLMSATADVSCVVTPEKFMTWVELSCCGDLNTSVISRNPVFDETINGYRIFARSIMQLRHLQRAQIKG
jgi:hypothetical protein